MAETETAVKGYAVRVEFAFGGSRIVARFDNASYAVREGRNYLGSDAKDVVIVHPDGREVSMKDNVDAAQGICPRHKFPVRWDHKCATCALVTSNRAFWANRRGGA